MTTSGSNPSDQSDQDNAQILELNRTLHGCVGQMSKILLSELHQEVFCSEVQWYEDRQPKGVFTVSNRRVAIFVDCIPRYRLLKRRYEVRMVSRKRLQAYPLPAAFVIQPVWHCSEVYECAYFINSEGLMPILGGRAARVILTQKSFATQRAIFDDLIERFVEMLVHEMRHEAQTFVSDLKMRELSFLRENYPRLAYEDVEAEWQSRMHYYTHVQKTGFKEEEDAYVVGMAASIVWLTAESSKERIAIIKRLVLE